MHPEVRSLAHPELYVIWAQDSDCLSLGCSLLSSDMSSCSHYGHTAHYCLRTSRRYVGCRYTALSQRERNSPWPSLCLLVSHIDGDLCRVEEVLKPAMDRKVFGPFTAHKNTMRSSMNESFKLGLRNALTGL